MNIKCKWVKLYVKILLNLIFSSPKSMLPFSVYIFPGMEDLPKKKPMLDVHPWFWMVGGLVVSGLKENTASHFLNEQLYKIKEE